MSEYLVCEPVRPSGNFDEADSRSLPFEKPFGRRIPLGDCDAIDVYLFLE